jgi:hypothetical protein
MHALRLPLVLAVLVSTLAGAVGCSAMQRWTSRDESELRASRLQETQLKVMRFADEYGGRIRDPLQALSLESPSAELRLAAQNWRITQSTAAYTIASGPNPVVNALDMIVLATLSRIVIQDYWKKELYGERASQLLDVHRNLEDQSWKLVESVLDFDQITQLRAVIEQWRAENPKARAVAQIRFTDFAAIQRRPDSKAHGGGSLFALIGLDPLRNLDPAVREIEQTRQLAERTIYYLQRAPSLLDMQIERLVYQLAIMPEAKQTLAGVERIGGAAEAIGRLTHDAPAIIANERHAIIAELTAALHQEEARMQELLIEVRGVLNAGAQTSDSVGATVAALDAFVGRFQPKGLQPAATSAAGRPFDITEYAATARELASTAQSVQALLVQADASSAAVERLASVATQDLRDVVDHAFWRGVALIAVLALSTLVAALTYRYAAARMPTTYARARAAL